MNPAQIFTPTGYLDLRQETPTLFTDGVHYLLRNYGGTWTFLTADRPTIGDGKTAQEAYDNWARCLTDNAPDV